MIGGPFFVHSRHRAMPILVRQHVDAPHIMSARLETQPTSVMRANKAAGVARYALATDRPVTTGSIQPDTATSRTSATTAADRDVHVTHQRAPPLADATSRYRRHASASFVSPAAMTARSDGDACNGAPPSSRADSSTEVSRTARSPFAVSRRPTLPSIAVRTGDAPYIAEQRELLEGLGQCRSRDGEVPRELRRHTRCVGAAVGEDRGVARRQPVIGRPFPLVSRVTRVVHLRIGELHLFDCLVERHAAKVGRQPVVRQSERSVDVNAVRAVRQSRATRRIDSRNSNNPKDAAPAGASGIG